jgi:hypothetical protein
MLNTRLSKVLTLSLTAALLAAGVLGAAEKPGDRVRVGREEAAWKIRRAQGGARWEIHPVTEVVPAS